MEEVRLKGAPATMAAAVKIVGGTSRGATTFQELAEFRRAQFAQRVAYFPNRGSPSKTL